MCQVPCGVAVSSQQDGGRIYVADYNNRRVVRLTRNGRYDGCFVAAGTSSTQLVQPQALDFAADGRLVVVDRTHVKIFDVGVRPTSADASNLLETVETSPSPPSVDGDTVVASDAKHTATKPKPTRTGPKPAVPPRPEFLKDMAFTTRSDQGQRARAKTVISQTSSVPLTTSTTTPSSTASRTLAVRQASTSSVTSQTPTKSCVETEVW